LSERHEFSQNRRDAVILTGLLRIVLQKKLLPLASRAEPWPPRHWPAGASARQALVVAERGEPAYVYRFTRLAPGSDPIKVGAFHSAELAYVFGTQASIDRPWSARDRELSQQMQQYWTNFAKSGNPNGEGLPAWPRFGVPDQRVMELGDVTRPIAVLDPQKKALFDAYLATRLPQ